MININLKELYNDKDLCVDLRLIITPQSPLSISGVLNSKYIKCKRNISDNMVYGMIENMIGFHLDSDIRKIIVKKFKLSDNYTNGQHTKSRYNPIISDICKIGNIDIPLEESILVDDFSCHVKFSDSRSFSTSSHDISLKGILVPKTGENLVDYGKYSNYYKTLGTREYFVYNKKDKIIIDIKVSKTLSEIMIDKNYINKVLYLGNSESLVNVELIKL